MVYPRKLNGSSGPRHRRINGLMGLMVSVHFFACGGGRERLLSPPMPRLPRPIADGLTYHTLNRGKQSLAIDIRRPEAQEVIHRLVRDIDVVVINYRPDVAAHLRIDYETLRGIRPDLIYVDNTAFGRLGEMAGRPGYDIVVQAMCGLIALGGKTDSAVRIDSEGNTVVSVAVPIQHMMATRGALQLSTQGNDIDRVIASERRAILRFFAVLAAVMLLLSLSLLFLSVLKWQRLILQ